jgi:hypothetical protein
MKTMLRAFLALVLTCAAFAAGAQPAPQPLLARTTTTYGCSSSESGECRFILYTSDCRKGGARDAHPSVGCTYALFAEFSLKVGESKTFDPIPPNVKQCQPRNGRLVFPDCAR